MSYNESYADKNIGDYAYGDGVDKGAASTYGEVFVEHTSQDLEAECRGVTCYVACSCKNNGPDDKDGWFSTIAEAQHGNPNAQVYTVTSDIHYSRDSVSTSSLNDLTIATASTTALANQTPISRASTLSSLTIDAPTLKTASTSGTKATCYKMIPCADGYFATEPTSDQREAIEFYEDTSTGITCYKSNYCKDGYTDDISLKKDGTDSYAYDDTLTCYVERTDLKEIEFYVDTYNSDCLYYLDYNIIDSEGDESYNGDVEGKTANLGIKCGSSTETYTTIVYYDEPSDGHFNYTCSQGNASLESITIGGQTYEDGDIMTVDVYDEGTYDLPVRLGIRSSDTCNPSCPSGYFPTEPTSAQREAMDFDEDTSTGITCYKPTCKTGDWFVPSYCNQYPGACGSSVSYENTTCYESLIPDDIYFSTTLGDPATCGFTSTYSITSKNGENLSAIELDNEDVMVGIKCGTNIQTYNTTLYHTDATNKSTFYYECNRGEATFTSISIGGYTYTGPGDTITLDLGRAGTHDFRVNISSDMQGDQCMTSCPDGYYSTEDECRTSIINQGGYYGMHGTCEYDSSSQCYKLYMCPINEGEYILSQPPTDVYNYTTKYTTPSGKTCYKATSCKSGYTTDDTGFNCSGFPGLRCCQEVPYYLNLYISGTNNLGFYEYTTTYTVTTESGQGNSSWTVSDLTNASVDLSCNGSYPPTQFKGLTFSQNASASANTKTITGYGCSGLPELEAVAINNYTISDGEEYTMNVAVLGASNLHVKINYSTYDPCGQNSGFYALKADCEATITDANTQVCQTTSASNYRCYEVVNGCNSNNGYYTLESDCKKGSMSYSYAGCQLDSSSGCYKQSYCDTALGYYSLSSDEVVTFSSSYTELTNGTGTKCRTVAGCNESNGYYASSPNTTYFTTSSTTSAGQTCYYATGCASGYTTSGSGTSYKSGNVTCYKESSSNSCPTDIWFMVIKHSDDDTPHYQLAYNMTKNGTICLTNQSSPNSYCNLSNNMWYTAPVNVYVGYNYTINNADWHLTDDPNGSYDGVGYDVGEITKVNYITINGNKYYDGDTINLDVVDVADDCEMTLHLGLYDSSDFQN